MVTWHRWWSTWNMFTHLAFQCLHGCPREHLAIDEALYSVAVFQWFLCLWEGIFRLVLGKCGKTTRVALRKALECLTCHPRVRLLARATLSRAIVDSFANSWESDARCAFVLQSSLQTFDAKLCSFSNNFAGNVFSEPRSKETLSAVLSQESTITLERVARGTNLIHAWIINEAFESVVRGKSLMHAWIIKEALGSVSHRDSWLFVAIPEHKSQNSHYN